MISPSYTHVQAITAPAQDDDLERGPWGLYTDGDGPPFSGKEGPRFERSANRIAL